MIAGPNATAVSIRSLMAAGRLLNLEVSGSCLLCAGRWTDPWFRRTVQRSAHRVGDNPQDPHWPPTAAASESSTMLCGLAFDNFGCVPGSNPSLRRERHQEWGWAGRIGDEINSAD